MTATELRNLRQSACMSQADLAVEVGVTVPAVSQWERGLTHPRDEHERKTREVIARRRRLLLKLLAFVSADGEGPAAG